MVNTQKTKRLYEKIQNKLFYIIPEKWDKVCLYASVLEQMEDVLAGEMYFYYFPRGILKMRPINGYEIPIKYNISEESYNKHLEELYTDIKSLWKEFINSLHRPWYSITISIENFKFKIEYNYTDIRLESYSNEQRHVIWSYKNLGKNLDSFDRKERKIIEKYMIENSKQDIELYEEAIYKNPVAKSIGYRKEQSTYIKLEENIENRNRDNANSEDDEKNIIVNNEILLNKGIN